MTLCGINLDQLDQRMRLELPPEFWEWADREHPE